MTTAKSKPRKQVFSIWWTYWERGNFPLFNFIVDKQNTFLVMKTSKRLLNIFTIKSGSNLVIIHEWYNILSLKGHTGIIKVQLLDLYKTAPRNNKIKLSHVFVKRLWFNITITSCLRAVRIFCSLPGTPLSHRSLVLSGGRFVLPQHEE